MGFDAAYGIAGRDDDAICVMDKYTTPVRQVAEVQGKIGERLDRIVYALARYYNGAFIVGERQVGLPTLRRLSTEYLYGWMYYQRDEKGRSRRYLDALGHARVHDDVHMREFRRASIDHEFILRSPALLDQMGRTEFRERTRSAMDAERKEDETLIIKLAGGGSPDLVMAAVYCWLGIQEMPRYERPKDAQQQILEEWLGEAQPERTHFKRGTKA
jgi:hypothetical protein